MGGIRKIIVFWHAAFPFLASFAARDCFAAESYSTTTRYRQLRRLNQARNRTAGNTPLMHAACNLYIHMEASGWSGSCDNGIKVTSAELSSQTNRYERNRFNLINPMVLKMTVAYAVCTWRC